ncbi:MAG: hypothetical protein KAR43_10240, partial [Deltaproteobacteria bacterium]|nr:hypothetical protein [Deltaproteobacteria bacterium]
MISLFKCCYLIVVICILGDVVNSICFKKKFKKTQALRCSIAYGLGTGTLGILTFYLSYMGGNISFRNTFFLSLPFIAYFICSPINEFKTCIFNIKFLKINFNKGILDYFFLALIILSLSIITFRALFLPMHLADEQVQWG